MYFDLQSKFKQKNEAEENLHKSKGIFNARTRTARRYMGQKHHLNSI